MITESILRIGLKTHLLCYCSPKKGVELDNSGPCTVLVSMMVGSTTGNKGTEAVCAVSGSAISIRMWVEGIITDVL